MTADLVAALTDLTTTLNTVITTERERNRDEPQDTVWGTQWYVYSDERGEVEYKSEEAAYEGARYWVANSKRPATVDVFNRETQTKVYPRSFINRAAWTKDDLPTSGGINSPL